MDWKIELAAIAVTDVDRAKAFCVDQVGFHADHDYQVSDTRPGGLLAVSDGLDTPARRELHEDDVFVPVDPGTLEARLRAAGFGHAQVDVAGDRLRFAALR